MLPKKRSVKAPAKSVAVEVTNLVVPKKARVKTTSVNKKTSKITSSIKAISTPIKANQTKSKKTVTSNVKPKKVVQKKSKVSEVGSIIAREEVVMLEGTISKRLLEKKQAYEVWFREKAVDQFSNVAYVFGYFFILAGLLSSIFIVNPDWSHFTQQPAAIPCADSRTCEESTSSSTNPKIVYVTTPEVTPGQDLVVTVEISNVASPVLVVASPVLTPPLRLLPASQEENVYTYQVPTSTLPPSEYRLRIEGITKSSVVTSFVGPLITLEALNQAISLGEEVSSSSPSDSPDLLNEVLVDWKTEPHQLSISEQTATIPTIVTFVSMYQFETVAFYMRPDQATNEFLLGQAELQNDSWVYRLDQSKLPSGTYTIIAKGIDEGVVKAEAFISYKNLPITSIAEKEKITNSSSTTSATDETTTELLKALSIENHAGTTSGHEEEQGESVDTEIQTSSTSTLGYDLPESIGTILSVFALAKQSNHELLLRVSEVALEEGITKSVATYGSQHEEPAAIAAFETNLRSELKKEQALIALNNQNSNAFYPADTDLDGITDTEEDASDGMSSRLADTDNDGYLDGIEQIFGYDPTSASPETVFRLPVTSTDVPQTETVLGIEAIQPLALFDAEETKPHIYLQVSGFAIPNSYIVLAIQASEIVALVPVDESGTFTHIIESDLADDEYTASVFYVANSGAYVAASRPFTFTKDAEASNYIKTAAPNPVLGASLVTSNPKTPYLPGSLGVLALGLTLLYISRSMRHVGIITEKVQALRV